MTTEIPKRRHHFVPITYLKSFCDDRGKVFAYRKDNISEEIYTNPINVGVERDYYSQLTEDGNWDHNSLENFFGKYEEKWAPIAAKIRNREYVNHLWNDVVQFMTLLRARVPATRDMVEINLASTVKETAFLLDRTGQLPPKPPGHDDILDKGEFAIDPQRSIAAMKDVALGFAEVLGALGFEILCNETNEPFVTSDNPVFYFEPQEEVLRIQPYRVNPFGGKIELYFPIDPISMLHGSNSLKTPFEKYGLTYSRLDDLHQVTRINTLLARAGYRLLFASLNYHHKLFSEHAEVSPVVKNLAIRTARGVVTINSVIFGPRPAKPAWRPEYGEPPPN